MMYVYAIARLERDIQAKDKVLVDLDSMVIKIIGDPWTNTESAMVGMVVALETKVFYERKALVADLKKYQHQRDLRAEAT